jgi:hypothetical protein
MNRTLSVVRMQLVNRQTFVWVPLIILGASFVLSLVIWSMIPYGGTKYSGGAQAPLWYFVAIGVMALAYTFPFSQAMSVTRRQFFFGTLITAAGASAMLAIVFIVGGLLEQATGGWGMAGYFFYLDAVWERGPLAAGFTYFVMALLLFVIGMWSATIFKRFGVVAVVSAWVAIALILVGGMWLVGRMDAWGDLFGWLGSQGTFGLTLWALVPLALFSGASYLTLRRATP